jgi:uncharacterized Fe-S cluster-containing protein
MSEVLDVFASGNVYVLVDTACAVREKDHKIFEFPENLVRKQKPLKQCEFQPTYDTFTSL